MKLKAGETTRTKRNKNEWIPLGEKSPEARSGVKGDFLVAQKQAKLNVGLDRVTPSGNSKNFRNLW